MTFGELIFGEMTFGDSIFGELTFGEMAFDETLGNRGCNAHNKRTWLYELAS